jgi:nucleotide-binding universal stress UspA family protein
MVTPTARMDRILCPTDFSAFSVQALRHALALARTFHSRLRVVHVIPNIAPGSESVYGGAPWLLTAEGRQGIDEEMRKFLEPLREARVDHEHEVREGEPWREIVAAAAEMDANLAVLGTHGRGGLDHLFLGSVAEKLIRRLPCPVWTVSHEEGRISSAPGLLGRILCATDFSEMSAEALRVALAFAEKHNAGLTLLHVIEDLSDLSAAAHRSLFDIDVLRQTIERRGMERLRRIVDEASVPGVRIEPRAVLGRAYEEILRAGAEEKADLIVIGAQGHGFFEHLLSGSNAQQVIRRATCPVLTVRPLGHKARAHDAGRAGLALAAGAEAKG